MQRADRLTEPPVVGRHYLVPAIFWNRTTRGNPITDTARALWWPVWGAKHRDAEYFKFEPLHYHVDPRFLSKRHWAQISSFGRTKLQTIQGFPLSHLDMKEGPPTPTLRRMKCSLAHAQWGHDEAASVMALNNAFKGQTCAAGKRGLVCPHKKFSLASVQPIDGIITCPLHGLRIEAATGRCLGPASTELSRNYQHREQ